MKLPGLSKLVTVLLIGIIALAVLLRVFSIGHSLSWDEAWNANSIMDGATGHTDDASTFFPNFYRHPPAYTGLGILYAKVGGAGRTGLAWAMEITSILFAVLLVLAIYCCGAEWFGKGAGLVSAFLFALMPAARVYDTWIKQESMTLFFCMLFLLFFFRGRTLLSGLMLGLAFLTKEIAIFVPLAVFAFVIARRRFDFFKKLVKSGLFAVALSAWWYLLFSRTAGTFTDFFLGRDQSAHVWKQSWYFYVERIPRDIGWAALALAALGLLAFFTWPGRGAETTNGEGLTTREMVVFVGIWVVIVYLPLSISYGKPPWMVYSALPALALLGGWGAAELYRAAVRRMGSARGLVVFLIALVCVAATSMPYGYDSYVRGADVMYPDALRDRRVAEYVNRVGGPSARVMMRDADMSPIFAYYLESYAPGRIALLPLEPTGQKADAGAALLLLNNSTGFEQAVRQVDVEMPDFLLLRKNAEIAALFSKGLTPKVLDGIQLYELSER